MLARRPCCRKGLHALGSRMCPTVSQPLHGFAADFTFGPKMFEIRLNSFLEGLLDPADALDSKSAAMRCFTPPLRVTRAPSSNASPELASASIARRCRMPGAGANTRNDRHIKHGKSESFILWKIEREWELKTEHNGYGQRVYAYKHAWMHIFIHAGGSGLILTSLRSIYNVFHFQGGTQDGGILGRIPGGTLTSFGGGRAPNIFSHFSSKRPPEIPQPWEPFLTLA